jgi:UDP-hydrolysing UDP-N-acetyl-D-glucosamine 2-epimerase
LLGDRYETHAAATAAMLMNIPIAHIHGGEITEGAVDEQIRHSITKMSYLHFCATETYRQRVIQMGEDPVRVFNSGAPGIDNIINLNLLTKKILEKELSWKFTSKSALFTYHPVTLEENDIAHDLEVILSILETFSFNILFTYANADAGGRVINQKIEQFCKIQPAKYKVVKSLGQVKYLSAMKYVDLLIGNTSSGIIEAASFKKPVVNIGDRQKGRLRGENVIDCNLNTLQESIKLALSSSFRNKIKNMNNIYGTGSAADFIVDKLINEPISVIKKFRDQH